MNYNVNDENFKNSEMYQRFLRENPSFGFLKIRAYAANQAVPISNLKIVITKDIENNNVTFFEGTTNDSGVIERIILPAPLLNQNDLIAPASTTYEIRATYTPDNITQIFRVNMYENVGVIQNINIVPDMNMGMGGF